MLLESAGQTEDSCIKQKVVSNLILIGRTITHSVRSVRIRMRCIVRL